MLKCRSGAKKCETKAATNWSVLQQSAISNSKHHLSYWWCWSIINLLEQRASTQWALKNSALSPAHTANVSTVHRWITCNGSCQIDLVQQSTLQLASVSLAPVQHTMRLLACRTVMQSDYIILLWVDSGSWTVDKQTDREANEQCWCCSISKCCCSEVAPLFLCLSIFSWFSVPIY